MPAPTSSTKVPTKTYDTFAPSLQLDPSEQRDRRVEALREQAINTTTASISPGLGGRISTDFLQSIKDASSKLVQKYAPRPPEHRMKRQAILSLQHSSQATRHYDSRIQGELDSSKNFHHKKQMTLEALREISKVTGDSDVILKDHPELQNRLTQLREHFPSLSQKDKLSRDDLDELRDCVKDIRDQLITSMSSSRSQLDNHMGEKLRYISALSKIIQMLNQAASAVLHNVAPPR